jgi:hypothetical protein
MPKGAFKNVTVSDAYMALWLSSAELSSQENPKG